MFDHGRSSDRHNPSPAARALPWQSVSIVGNGDDPPPLSCRDFRQWPHLCSPPTPRQSATRERARNFARSRMKRVTEALSVHWLRIWHAANRREPAARRRRVPFRWFGRFLSRLAQVNMDIDKTGSDDQPAGIEYFRVLPCGDFPSRPNFLYLFSVSRTSRAASSSMPGSTTRRSYQKHWRIPWVLLRARDEWQSP